MCVKKSSKTAIFRPFFRTLKIDHFWPFSTLWWVWWHWVDVLMMCYDVLMWWFNDFMCVMCKVWDDQKRGFFQTLNFDPKMEPSTRAVSTRSVRASWGALKVRSSAPHLCGWDAEQEKKNLEHHQQTLGVLTSSAAGARRSWARCGAYLTTGSSPRPWDSWKQACVNAVSTCGHQKILWRILWCGVSWRHTGRVTCRRECSPQNHTKCCDVLCNNIMTRSRRDRHVYELNDKKKK